MTDRAIAASMMAALTDTPLLFVDGARQTGKSTLVQALAAGPHPARYVTLDDTTPLAAATADPAGFLEGFDGPTIIDEVQRAPGLYLALKAAIDRDRSPGRFILTGSADAMLLPELASALVGRMERFTLWPFAQGELTGQNGFIDAVFAPRLRTSKLVGEPLTDTLERVARGGYPEVQARTATRRRNWFEAYITTLLQRDIRELARIEGLTDLPRLLGLLATRTSTLLNYAELSRSITFPQTTLKRYMALLEAVFLVQTLPAWSNNLGKRHVKTPKLMLHDSGLATHLLGLDAAHLKTSAHLGPVLESFVAMEAKKQASWSSTRPALLHYRTHTGLEVDLVLEASDGRVVGIETKSAAHVDAKDFKGLRALAEDVGANFHRGIILYAGHEAVAFGSDLHALPLTALWSFD